MTTLDFAIPVQALIPRVEDKMRNQANGYREELAFALDQLIAAGGKRVRPTVTLLVSAILGADDEKAITLAAAIELLHTATLVHDDLIDGALTRRGMPTLNALWDYSASVLAGDFLFSQAAYLAADVGSINVMRMFAKTLSTVVNGEISQVLSLNHAGTRDEYYERIYAKTASMFELAARSPAYLIDDGEKYAEALLLYGHEIGLAFQIVDDVLDFSLDADVVGKPIANDLTHGLLTLPVFIFSEGNPENSLVKRVFEGKPLTEEEYHSLIKDIQASDALTNSLQEAKDHQMSAIQALQNIPAGPEKQALLDLADYVLARLH
jgi:geranylgeranyl pyrophosphate synthase